MLFLFEGEDGVETFEEQERERASQREILEKDSRRNIKKDENMREDKEERTGWHGEPGR